MDGVIGMLAMIAFFYGLGRLYLFAQPYIDKFQIWRGTKKYSLEEQSERRKKMMDNIRKSKKK